MKLAIALVALWCTTAAAQPGADPLAEAGAALAANDFERALELAVVDDDAPVHDRAEAHRVRGLAHFFLGAYADAEAELVAYLELELDATLDPTQYPPEAVSFFEDVRTRHAAALKKKRPRQRRYKLLNLIPPIGQIQNKQYTRAWVFGGIEVALAATHLTTYFVLRSQCDGDGFTCESGGTADTTSARRLRFVNYASGAALIGVYLYGVIDGFRGYGRRSRERAEPVVSAVEGGGLTIGASVAF